MDPMVMLEDRKISFRSVYQSPVHSLIELADHILIHQFTTV